MLDWIFQQDILMLFFNLYISFLISSSVFILISVSGTIWLLELKNKVIYWEAFQIMS